MVERIDIPKQDLFTGDEPTLHAQTFTLPVDGMSFSPGDLGRNFFWKLQDQLGDPAFEQVIADAGIERYKDTFKGSDGLSLKFMIRDGRLFVFAIGERSPGQFRLILEGAWKIS
jgi:hypothetical protein